jgi:hypothetical protein
MVICRPNALPFSGVGAAKPAVRFYTMSLRRPHPLQRLVRRYRPPRDVKVITCWPGAYFSVAGGDS